MKSIHNLFFLLLFTSVIKNSVNAQPFIQSFSPITAPIGSMIIIHGTNFSSTASNNIVRFGSVRSEVILASATSLSVIVPAGLICESISVTTDNLTSYSNAPFSASFIKDTLPLNSSSFDAQSDITTGGAATDIAIGDFNDDGKPDLVSANYNSGTISVIRNSTVNNIVSFETSVSYPCGAGARNLAIADIDGDGKQDVVVTNYSVSTISIFKNISTISSIEFSPKIDITTGSLPSGIDIKDLNGDGKPDLVVACTNERAICVFKNTSSPGVISFSPRLNFQTENNPFNVAIADIDQDGKPDVIISNYGASTISIYKNKSTDSIILAAKMNFYAGNAPAGFAINDINGDGKLDIIIANNTSSTPSVSILPNESFPGQFSFKQRMIYSVNSGLLGVSVYDLSGDGLPDIIASSRNNTISILKNKSLNGTTAFDSPADINVNGSVEGLIVCDLNADKNPDISIGNYSLGKVSIFMNSIDNPYFYNLSPMAGNSNSNIIITGRNLNQVIGVNFGNIPAQSFAIISNTTISATPGNGNTGTVSLLTANGNITSSKWFDYVLTPVIDSFSPHSATTGQAIVINGSNLNGATSVTLGGIPVTYFSSTYSSKIIALVGKGASGELLITTAGGIASKDSFIFSGPVISSFSPMVGGDGTLITIIGEKFTGATVVKIGGIPVTYTIIDSATIVANATNVNSGDIEVVTPLGTTLKQGFIFTAPVITSFTPLRAGFGKTINITGTNFTGTTQVIIGGTPAAFTIISPEKITAVIGPGNTGMISVTSSNGTDTMNGFIFVPPPQIISFSPHNAGPGSTITITGTNFIDIDTVSISEITPLYFTNTSPDTLRATFGNIASGSVRLVTTGGVVEVSGFTYLTPPIIDSFTPLSGPIGTTVFINGNNFSPFPDKNKVYFGTVSANVIAATKDQLTVIVPTAASFEPITVATNSLMSYSQKPFKVTYSDSFNVFLQSSFPLTLLPNCGIYLNESTTKDLNDDGKPDILNANSNTFSLRLNTSISGKLGFENKVEQQSVFGNSIRSVDFDGDGKNDVAVATSGKVLVYKNIGSGNNLEFAPKQEFTADYYANLMAIGDIDGDGKTDIVVTNPQANTFSIFRNNSSQGEIIFDTKIDFRTGESPRAIAIADLDGDKRPDIVFVNHDSYNLSVIRNISSPGVISLLPGSDYTTTTDPLSVTIGDLDNDNKQDIVVTYGYGNTLSIFKNVSQGDDIIFNQKIDISSTNIVFDAAIGDLDGDGRLDLVTTGVNAVTVYKNTSLAGGTISFADKVNLEYAGGSQGKSAMIADFDGDKKADIAITSNSNYDVGISMYRNQLGEANTTAICNNGSTSFLSNRTGTNYQWQVDYNGNGFINLTNNANYSGINTNTLQLSNIPTSFINYKFRCIVDGITSYIFAVKFNNTWQGNYSNLWNNPLNWSCRYIPDLNTDVIVSGGNVIVNINSIVRSLTISPYASVTVNTGNTLSVVH